MSKVAAFWGVCALLDSGALARGLAVWGEDLAAPKVEPYLLSGEYLWQQQEMESSWANTDSNDLSNSYQSV